jgi:hypothetical protein
LVWDDISSRKKRKENLDVTLECDDYGDAYYADLSDRAIEKLKGIQDG